MDKNLITVLNSGGTAVLLTDTLYGIVGQALNKKAVDKIYLIKKRNKKKPLIILIASVQDLKLFGVKVDVKLKSELVKFWPGPNSIILPCSSKKYYLHRGKKCLAFRLPKSKRLISLLKRTGPLVAPSANPEGLPPAKNITEARKYFGESVDLYVKGGKPKEKASRLVKFNNRGVIKIIRQ